LIQAPWLYLTGTYFFNEPGFVMQTILTTLTVEDVICAVIADILQTHYHLREQVFPKLTVVGSPASSQSRRSYSVWESLSLVASPIQWDLKAASHR